MLAKISTTKANVIVEQIMRLADPKIAQHSRRFFKRVKVSMEKAISS